MDSNNSLITPKNQDNMSNVKLAEAIYDAFNQGDMKAMLDYVDEDVQMFTADYEGKSTLANTYQGKAQVLAFFKRLARGADIQCFKPSTFIDKGDNVVIVNQICANEKFTGRPMENEIVQIATFEGGKLTQLRTNIW